VGRQIEGPRGPRAQLPSRDCHGGPGAISTRLVLSPIPHSSKSRTRRWTRARTRRRDHRRLELWAVAQQEAVYSGITGHQRQIDTTALMEHSRGRGQRVEVGGNSRNAGCTGADGPRRSYVIEASSFQLELITTLDFDNRTDAQLTPDHL